MDDVMFNIKKIINNDKFKFFSKLLIIGLFLIFSILVAGRHEHWSDEAQSFLLARDNSFLEIFKYIKYEGTPPLWVLVIKIFILFGGTYKTFYILPIIFNTIGLVLLLYKVKVPWYIKVLFPFTYFIFFQYSIVARSYCMVFPMLMIIALIYKKRFDKPILYSFILFLFMNISLHTLMIAGSFYLIYIIESILDKKIKLKKVKLGLVLMFIMFLLTTIIVFPSSDCDFGVGVRVSLFRVLMEATIGSNLNVFLETLFGIIILVVFIVSLNRTRFINFLILLLPVSFVLMFVAFQIWHVGVIWLLMFSYFIISGAIMDSRLIKIFVVIVCLVQGYWNVSSIIYDYNNNYTGAYDTYKYLEDYVNDDYKIYGFGYSKTAINPYFDKNIFDNKLIDKAFHIWISGSKEMNLMDVIDPNVDIFVISDFYKNDYLSLISFLEYNDYEKYEFEGFSYIKDHIYETQGFIVYKKKKL